MAYPVVSLASLLVQETKSAIYTTAIRIARAIGVPVSTWQAGDPTRSLFWTEAETLSDLEEIVSGYISSNFLDYAHGDWLKIGAQQRFNVDVPLATFASTDVVLSNAGGGLYAGIDPGDLTFKSTASGKTYRNSTGGTLASGPGTTLTVTVIAEEAGSASSAGAGDIDELVTTLLGVTCTNPIAAVGLDEQDESITVKQCKDKIDAISPMGARGAYRYFARRSDLTGTDAVTRVRVYGDTDTGDVYVYLAGPSGGVSDLDVLRVDAVLLARCTPICATLHTYAATNVTVDVAYELWVYKSSNLTEAQIAAVVQVALEKMFAILEIGGDVPAPPAPTGSLYKSLIESTIRGIISTKAFRAELSAPTVDVSLVNGEVAVLGTVTPTIHLVVDP